MKLVDEELNEQLEQLYKVYPLYRELFLEQLRFILDPNLRVVALCSSRAGKTSACAIDIAQTLMLNPNSVILYLGLTDDSIQAIFMPIMQDIVSRHGLKIEIYKNRLKFSNGSQLLLLGANNSRKVENFRGLKLLKCYIDECASFDIKILEYLVNQVIAFRLIDKQGKLYLLGTPASHCSGMFHKVTNEDTTGWSVHHWTGFDNPYIKDNFELAAKEYLVNHRCDSTDPIYMREFLGVWVADEVSLMVPIPQLVDTEFYEPGKWRSVIGVDIGYNDQTAFSIVGWKHNNPQSYVIKTFGFNGEDAKRLGIGMIDLISRNLMILKDVYQPASIVMDPSGGKILIDQFSRQYHLNIKPAQKNEKKHYIEIMNSAILKGDLVLMRDGTKGLMKEISSVVWNEERTREREGLKCDELDATIYAYREAFHYLEKIPIRKEPLTLKDITKKYEDKLLQDLEIKRLDDSIYDEAIITDDPFYY